MHRAQKAFRLSKSLYRGFVGGRGAGKSWIGAYDLIRRSKRDRTYLIGSPTGILLQDTTFPTFKTIAQDLGVWDPAGVRLTPYPTVRLSTGASVRFRTAEDPERMRGPNLSGVWLDEASLMHHDAYTIAIASLREAGEQGWLSATFTPKGLGHWTYAVFGKQNPNTEIFHAETRDNPFNPPGFHETLAKQYTGLRADQELRGRFTNVEGAEWPANYFSDSIFFHDWPAGFIRTALALDPAQGKNERKKGCYASFVFAGLDAHATLWLDCWASRDWDASRLVSMMFDLNGRLHPNAVSVEVNGGQAFLVPLIAAKAKELKVTLPLYTISNSVNKEVRIRDLGPYLAQGKIRVKDTPGGRLLVQQMRDFPVGEYVDCPDSAEMAVRMIRAMLGQRGGVGQPEIVRG